MSRTITVQAQGPNVGSWLAARGPERIRERVGPGIYAIGADFADGSVVLRVVPRDDVGDPTEAIADAIARVDEHAEQLLSRADQLSVEVAR